MSWYYLSLTSGAEYTYWTPGLYIFQSEATSGALAVQTDIGAHGLILSVGLRFNARLKLHEATPA